MRRMKLKFLIVSVMVLLLNACSSEQPPEDKQRKAAEECANAVIAESKALAARGITGKYKFTSIPHTTSARDGAFTSSEVNSIPYATSTYVDRGGEGSAWRECVEQKMKEKA